MIGQRIALATLAFVVLPGFAANGVSAADAANRFSARGLGTKDCSIYLEARAAGLQESEPYAHWFMGFLTAYNWLEPDTYDVSAEYNSNGLLRYLELYCQKDPTKRIIDAAMSFVRAVYERRVRVGS